jgi:hypothetical protein
MTKNVDRLSYITCRNMHKIMSQGEDEHFNNLLAQREPFISCFKILISHLIMRQKRKIEITNRESDKNAREDIEAEALTIQTELLLGVIPSDRIKKIVEKTSIWDALDQEEKNTLLLSSLFTNAKGIKESNIGKTRFDLYLIPQESADNFLAILSLGANLSEVKLVDQRAWFDVLLKNTLECNDYSDRIREILKAFLVESNVPLISKNQEIITKYPQTILRDIEKKEARIDGMPSDVLIEEEIESLKETLKYWAILEGKISYQSVTEASLGNISPPAQYTKIDTFDKVI